MASLTTVIPNYNHGHTIGRQLEAIFSQSRPPEKVLIFDDASTDDSVERIRDLIADHPNAELVVRPRNAGVIAAMNEGIRRSGTEYITFLAADDEVLPGFIEQSLAVLERYPQAAFASAISRVQQGGNMTAVPLPPAYPCDRPCFIAPERAAQLLMRMETWFQGTTVVHRRRYAAAAGAFRPELRSFCDGFLYLVEALRFGSCFIPAPLAIWHRDEHGYSSATSRQAGAMAEIAQAATALMKLEFADAFPAPVRSRIARRLRFRAASAGRGRLVQLALFMLLRWHDVPLEVRTRLAAGRIANA